MNPSLNDLMTAVNRPQPQAAAQSQPAGGGGLLNRLVHGFVQPFQTTGQSFMNIGKAGAAAATGNRKALENAGAAEQKLGLKNIALSGAQIPLYALNPFSAGAATAAKGAAVAADAGKVAQMAKTYQELSPVAKGALQGATFGGLSGANQEGATAGSIAKNVALGGAGGAVVTKGIGMLGKVLQKPTTPAVLSGASQTPVKPITVPAPSLLHNEQGFVGGTLDNATPQELAQAAYQKGSEGGTAKMLGLPSSTSKLSPPLQQIQDQLPKGYTVAANGDMFNPSGKMLTTGEIQDLTQPKYLSYFEGAMQQGNKKGMKVIAQQHPEDIRVQIKNAELGLPSPALEQEAQNVATGGTGDLLGGPKLPPSPTNKVSLLQDQRGSVQLPGKEPQNLPSPNNNSKVVKIQNATNNVVPNPTQLNQAPSPQPNILQRVGQALEKPAAGGKAPASPFGAAKEADINSFLKKEGLLTPGSNSQTIYEKLPGKFQEYQGQINKVLASDNNTVNPDGLIQRINTAIGENNHFLGSDTASEQVQKNVAAAVQKAGSKGNLTSQDLYSLKNQIQDELTRAYDKAAKGTPLTGGEDALLAARNAVNDFMPTAAKALGRKESMLYDASVGLNVARKESARIPGLAGLVLPKYKSTAAVHAAQSVGSAVGAPIEAVGNLIHGGGDVLRNAVGGLPEGIQNALGGTIERAAVPAVAQGIVNQPPESPQPQSNQIVPNTNAPTLPTQDTSYPNGGHVLGAETPQPTNDLGITSQKIEEVMLQDLAQTGGQNLSKLNTIYSIVNNQEKAAAAAQQQGNKPLTAGAASQVQSAQEAMNGIQAIQAAFNGTRSTGEGLFSKVLSKKPLGIGIPGSAGVQGVNSSIQVALPDIAKALGYGTSKAEMSALLNQLPSTSDTQHSAQIKLSRIANRIQDYMHQYLSTEANYVQPQNNMLDQLISNGIPSMQGVTQ